MVEAGLSVYDIATFFQVSPNAIGQSLNALEIKQPDIVSGAAKETMDMLKAKRDEYIQKEANLYKKDTSEVLETFGLYKITERNPYLTVADNWRNEHENCPEAVAVFDGESVRSIAKKKGTTLASLKVLLSEQGFEEKELAELGKELRYVQEVAPIWELIDFGFRRESISEYLNLDMRYVNKAAEKAKEYGYISKQTGKLKPEVVEQIRQMYLKGINAYEISEITGVHGSKLTTLKKDMNLQKEGELPLEFKKKERRALIWKMYTEDLLTQQEIADKLGLQRSTVITDLQKYRKAHPDEVDKTYLWRQRNMAEPNKAKRISKKKRVLAMYRAGMSAKDMAKIVGASESKVVEYLQEEGLVSTNPAKMPAEKRKRKAEELRLAWQGIPTTQIMGAMGQSRMTTLKDQHETANFLRNNPDALDYVTGKNGDVTKEAEDYKTI